jgi:hypothetical protein
MTEAPSSLLHGVAGEYFVAAELSRRGYIASITLRNTKGVDILASNVNASRSVGIQVKTHLGNRKGWLLNAKAENYSAPDLLYVFVRLPPDGNQPEFYVVPSKVVADAVRESFQWWLRTPGRRGQQRKDNSMRMFSDAALQPIHEALNEMGMAATVAGYRDRWDLLRL